MVVTQLNACLRIYRQFGNWENPMPSPTLPGSRVLGFECMGMYTLECPTRSAAHSAREVANFWCKSGINVLGSITTRSLLPLPLPTTITRRSKSTSLTRNDNPSDKRIPVPYSRRIQQREPAAQELPSGTKAIEIAAH